MAQTGLRPGEMGNGLYYLMNAKTLPNFPKFFIKLQNLTEFLSNLIKNLLNLTEFS